MEHLPRFILLHGPFQSCINFGKELMDRNRYIVSVDFEEPIVDGIIATMYDGAILDVRPDDFAFRESFIPTTQISFRTWVTLQKELMRRELGDDILGRIFMKEFQDGSHAYDHILMSDFDHAPDIKPLLKELSQREFCLVNLGPLTDTFMVNCGIHRCYWLATPDPKKQVDELLHRLNNERAA